jgi:hypothetical protein
MLERSMTPSIAFAARAPLSSSFVVLRKTAHRKLLVAGLALLYQRHLNKNGFWWIKGLHPDTRSPATL